MLVRVLEGLNQAKSFVHTAAHRNVVHGDLTKDAFVIDEKETSEGDAVILEVDAVVLGDLMGEVGEQRDVELACLQNKEIVAVVNPKKFKRRLI